MYWILMVMGLIVAVVGAVLVGGLVTPREHVATRSMVYAAKPETVWSVIRDFANYDKWREDMIEAEVITGGDPPVQWREVSSGGSILFGVIEEHAPHRMVARILDEDLPWGGTWTWEVTPAANGTKVTITEHGYVNNPIFRFIGTHFIKFTGTIDKYLRALGSRLASEPS
jgi:uncharacterized protein YndB with AHSA1/START domain